MQVFSHFFYAKIKKNAVAILTKGGRGGNYTKVFPMT